MFGRYRGSEFGISFERVLDYGAVCARDEWTITIDGEPIPPGSLNPVTWSINSFEQAIKRHIDRQIDGVVPRHTANPVAPAVPG